MDVYAFMDLLQVEVKGLSRYLSEDDYQNATNDAMRETGWVFPVVADFRLLWIKQRAKRNLFFYLFTESAHKFKYEQINLQHRFEHYNIIIANMDKAFKNAMEDHPEEFLDVTGMTDTVGMMGTKIDAGFGYSPAGEDITYLPENEINFVPRKD
ncbi:MAG: hypothetical protein DRN14_03625 [Thermoplasmata archaeon]|nr:MAG: hypothetical protein DRN14_03625 [Thermoplasmata archaeon]